MRNISVLELMGNLHFCKKAISCPCRSHGVNAVGLFIATGSAPGDAINCRSKIYIYKKKKSPGKFFKSKLEFAACGNYLHSIYLHSML